MPGYPTGRRSRVAPWDVRLWSHVAFSSPDECWPWTGYRDPHGYGRLYVHERDGGTGTMIPVPRLVLRHCHGVWPGEACHLCDNPACCNPLHLYDGTHRDNMLDAWARGRQPVAEARREQARRQARRAALIRWGHWPEDS
jgi:hypothetical protein